MKKMVCSTFMGLIFAAQPIWANYEVERLMDSYLLAKADSEQFPLSENEIKSTPYTIQVASYINEKDAVSHVEELKLQEKDVLYFPAFVRGQVWFKVCVGKFSKKDKAEEYRKTFVKRMDEPFAVVISLLDRPKSETSSGSTTTKLEVKTEKVKIAKQEERKLASVEPKAQALPAPTLVVATSGVYSLQIGAFDSEEIVKQKSTAAHLKDQEVYYKSALVNGKQWYRLFVGKFVSKKEAEDFQKLFKTKSGGTESFIRRVTASE